MGGGFALAAAGRASRLSFVALTTLHFAPLSMCWDLARSHIGNRASSCKIHSRHLFTLSLGSYCTRLSDYGDAHAPWMHGCHSTIISNQIPFDSRGAETPPMQQINVSCPLGSTNPRPMAPTPI